MKIKPFIDDVNRSASPSINQFYKPSSMFAKIERIKTKKILTKENGSDSKCYYLQHIFHILFRLAINQRKFDISLRITG